MLSRNLVSSVANSYGQGSSGLLDSTGFLHSDALNDLNVCEIRHQDIVSQTAGIRLHICQMFGRNMKVSFLAETSRCLQVFKRLPLELLWAPRLQNLSAILRIKMDFDEKTRSIQVNLAV